MAKKKITPTKEQGNIISYNGEILVVNAFAGTGKTSTLVNYALKKRGARILYVVFNRSIMKESSTHMPRNVTVVTGHKLAYQKIGVKYQHKLVNNLTPYKLIDLNLISFLGNDEKEMYAFAYRILEVINNFVYSTETEINKNCLATENPAISKKFYDGDVIRQALNIWSKMIDIKSEVPITHDVYLKLYHMTKPNLNKYDIIMFDEAQDANPVMIDIVMKQRGKKVFVGDKHQAIYGFRGAVDALDSIPANDTMYLSQSFRFGHNIANSASSVLTRFKQENVSLKGIDRPDSINGDINNGSLAYISRNNSTLFSNAAEMTKSGSKKIGFVGDIEGYKFDQLADLNNFKHTGKAKNAIFSIFDDFDELEEVAKQTVDVGMLAMLGTVKRYGDRIHYMINDIKNGVNKNPEVVFTTAHKSKGLEFDNVVLMNDFTELKDSTASEEVNLIYVAMTRAMNNLVLNDDLNKKITGFI